MQLVQAEVKELGYSTVNGKQCGKDWDFFALNTWVLATTISVLLIYFEFRSFASLCLAVSRVRCLRSQPGSPSSPTEWVPHPRTITRVKDGNDYGPPLPPPTMNLVVQSRSRVIFRQSCTTTHYSRLEYHRDVTVLIPSLCNLMCKGRFLLVTQCPLFI